MLTTGKSPGQDGFTAEFFKCYVTEFMPINRWGIRCSRKILERENGLYGGMRIHEVVNDSDHSDRFQEIYKTSYCPKSFYAGSFQWPQACMS